ncbi:MAG: hypothetical protein ACLQSR_06865 [Limisphaerales bacterium]
MATHIRPDDRKYQQAFDRAKASDYFTKSLPLIEWLKATCQRAIYRLAPGEDIYKESFWLVLD